jgi:uncharacterized protein (TIGR03083 family)
VTGLLAAERAALVALLTGLEPSEWRAATECPAWSVKGIALHLLGDDLSLLSRQRDNATNSLELYAEQHDGLTWRGLLCGFNEQWVDASRFVSDVLVVELLGLSGQWSADFYSSLDLEEVGEPVQFFGANGPSPYWQIVAREYMERWEHHHQIRRAVDAPDLGEPFLQPAADVAVRHFVAHLPDLETAPGTSIALTIPGTGMWTFTRGGDGWTLVDGATEDSDAQLVLEPVLATRVLSRGLPRVDTESVFMTSGNTALSERAVAAIAGLTSRDSTYGTA